MEAAGDVGRADDAQQFGVAAHLPGTEAFAEIGVEIDPVHHQPRSSSVGSAERRRRRPVHRRRR
jgi:hypothetical protein